MSTEDKLRLLKLDLPISTNAYDARLQQKILAAEEFIAREGITLSDSAEDTELVIMYAAYLWRTRRESNPVMPRSLRWALNNRLFGQKAAINDG